MLCVNEQTELEVLLSIEEPNQSQKLRIEYLQNKKDSINEIKSFEPVDIDSMECVCLDCFLKTIPEDSEDTLLLTEINRYFEYKSKDAAYSKLLKPEIYDMRETVLNECKFNQVINNTNSTSNIVTIDKVIDKYKENKLSLEQIKKITEDSKFIKDVYEACLFIIQKQIEITEKYKLKYLIVIQQYYMIVDLMFITLDTVDYEPSWDLVDIIHANMVNKLEIVPKLTNLVSNKLLHSNCSPTEEELSSILKGMSDENQN